MPKRDLFHAEMRQAFERDGWKITDDPLQFVWEDRSYFADLGIERLIGVERAGQKMAIEIKSFIGQNFSFDFYQALGQFDNYFIALSEIEPQRKVVLAISTATFEKFMAKKYVQRILEIKQVPLVIIDIETQTIEQWIR